MECSSCFKSIFGPDESKKDKDLEDFNASNASNASNVSNTIHILDDIVIINKDTETIKENFTNKDTNKDTEIVKENYTDKENENETETDKNKLIFPIVIDEMYCK